MAAMRESCAARSVPFVLFAFPQKVEVDAVDRASELSHYGYDPALFDLDAPYARLRVLAGRLGVPFVHPVEDFRAAQQIRPSDPIAFASAGLAEMCLGDRAAAEVDFRRSLDLNPNQPMLRRMLGQ